MSTATTELGCEECGGRLWHRSRWCWDCGHRRTAARERARKVARRMLPAIVARDGADCSLCGDPVDFAATWDRPLAATVDHVIPWARGGTNDLDNLRLAHRRCNESKGDR